jgi:predicted Zn-dependent peptidase
MQFREHKLANSLEVVAECNPQAHSLALGFFVRTGARDETDEVAGVSHFLEHMMFKGTPRRSADDVNRDFDAMGAHYNAFTSEEKTVYYAAVLPEYQGEALALLADILRPALRQEDFDTEKNVILEEIQMYHDQPPFGADDHVRALHFAGHPLGRSVLGTLDSIKALPLAAMRGYFERRYSPGNITVVAAGKVDFEALIDQAGSLCGSWAEIPSGRLVTRAAPHQEFACLHKEAATQEYCIHLANGPSATDDDRFAAKLLATVVGDETGSRMYWELVDPGLAEHASLGHYDFEGTGLFISYLCCAPDMAAENLARCRNLFHRVADEGIGAQELEQARNKINSRVVLASERPRGRLFSLGANWLHRREYRSVQDDLAAAARVTLDDVREVLGRYPLTQGTTVAIGPIEDLAVAAPAAA